MLGVQCRLPGQVTRDEDDRTLTDIKVIEKCALN